MTNTFVVTKHVFCRDKSMLDVTKLLSWHNYVCHNKLFLSWQKKIVPTICHDKQFCHDKRCLLLRQNYARIIFCHDKSFVTTNMCFVATNPLFLDLCCPIFKVVWKWVPRNPTTCRKTVESKPVFVVTHICHDKYNFVMTKVMTYILLLWQKTCFVVTNTGLSWQNISSNENNTCGSSHQWHLTMYLWWSLCPLSLPTHQVIGDSDLCCCVCVMSFKRWLTPLLVDSAQMLWASFCFRLWLFPSQFHVDQPYAKDQPFSNSWHIAKIQEPSFEICAALFLRWSENGFHCTRKSNNMQENGWK